MFGWFFLDLILYVDTFSLINERSLLVLMNTNEVGPFFFDKRLVHYS